MRRKNDLDQVSLFEEARERGRASEQRKQVRRVRDSLHEAILAFYGRRRAGDVFSAAELLRVVRQKHPHIAPDSPGRIMRLLRAEGLIGYKVVSRRDSLYRVLEPDGRAS
jgi:hypothetical protein